MSFPTNVKIRCKIDNYLNDASIKGIPVLISATLFLGLWDFLLKYDRELYYEIFNPVVEDCVLLSALSKDNYIKAYNVTKSHYEDFIHGRTPRFNMVHPDDEKLNRQRREYFDLYMKLLEEDPRLQDNES